MKLNHFDPKRGMFWAWVFSFGVFSAMAGMPPRMLKLPGREVGVEESRWVAPFVLASSYRIAESSLSSVRWFDDKGVVIKELKGTLYSSPEFISELRNGREFVHGLSGRWQLELPDKHDRSSSLRGTGDMLVHQYSSSEGQTMLDIYIEGHLAGSVGPNLSFRGFEATLGEDGSLAEVTYRSSEKKDKCVVVVAPGGKVSFTTDCAENVYEAWPLLGGIGALLHREKEPPFRFTYVSASGAQQELSVGTNARPLHCLGSDGKVLFQTSLGEISQYKLIECASGKVVWEIPSPVEPFTYSSGEAFVVDRSLLIFYGHDFAAVDAETGKVIARLKPNINRTDPGRFVRSGNRLFFVTGESFSEINEKDIRDHTGGWE